MANNILGSANSGLHADAWYSIQSFATDYYLGVGNSSKTIAQVSSSSDDTSLWQFVSGSNDASYAIKSKSSGGRYCLYPGPTLQPCASIAAQYRIYNDAPDAGGKILVPSLAAQSAALFVSANSSEGDAVGTANLDPLNVDPVELLWAISSVSAIDISAYPTVLPSASPDIIPYNATTLTTSTSSPVLTYPNSWPISSGIASISNRSDVSATPTESSTVMMTEIGTASSTPTETAPFEQATSAIIVHPATTGDAKPSAEGSASPSIQTSTGTAGSVKVCTIAVSIMSVAIMVWTLA